MGNAYVTKDFMMTHQIFYVCLVIIAANPAFPTRPVLLVILSRIGSTMPHLSYVIASDPIMILQME